MKLNEKQIADLMLFTKKHLVEYYDVQLELVDHLANDIEHVWQEYPKLTFDEAKQKAFKKFGIFGFQDVVEKKQKAMRKHYWKMFGEIFISFFKIPKILMTLSLVMGFYLIIANISFSELIVSISFIIILVLAMIKALQDHYRLKKKERKTGVKWLIENTSNALPAILLSIQIPIQLLRIFNKKIAFDSQLFWILSAFYIVFFAIAAYIITIRIPQKVQKIMQEQNFSYSNN
jgi:hypothetical protein